MARSWTKRRTIRHRRSPADAPARPNRLQKSTRGREVVTRGSQSRRAHDARRAPRRAAHAHLPSRLIALVAGVIVAAVFNDRRLRAPALCRSIRLTCPSRRARSRPSARPSRSWSASRCGSTWASSWPRRSSSTSSGPSWARRSRPRRSVPLSGRRRLHRSSSCSACVFGYLLVLPKGLGLLLSFNDSSSTCRTGPGLLHVRGHLPARVRGRVRDAGRSSSSPCASAIVDAKFLRKQPQVRDPRQCRRRRGRDPEPGRVLDVRHVRPAADPLRDLHRRSRSSCSRSRNGSPRATTTQARGEGRLTPATARQAVARRGQNDAPTARARRTPTGSGPVRRMAGSGT